MGEGRTTYCISLAQFYSCQTIVRQPAHAVALLTGRERAAQVKGGLECEGVRRAAASGGVWKSLVAIGKAEGFGGYWRGNFPQVRILPSGLRVHRLSVRAHLPAIRRIL